MHLLPSMTPEQGADLGHISVTEFLHSLFDLMLVGLDIHSECKCNVVLCLLCTAMVSGNLMMA